jgi:uncharacterized protein YeaO (DUF488 family)
MIRLKRAYEKPEKEDGARFLVDRLWPRGVKKESLKLEGWIKEVAPSNALRRWFGHDPKKWKEFQTRYFSELKNNPDTWNPLLKTARQDTITLLFGARDIEYNNAVALKAFLDKKLK